MSGLSLSGNGFFASAEGLGFVYECFIHADGNMCEIRLGTNV